MVIKAEQIGWNFTTAAPEPRVIPFPLNRRRQKVVAAARILQARKTEQGKARFWTRTVGDLAAELSRHGIDEATIERELSCFHAAVSSELRGEAREPPPSGG